MNAWFWPFVYDPGQSEIYWQSGIGAIEGIKRYAAFYALTSSWWDAGRAAGNALLIVLFGKPVLRLLRQALLAQPARWQALLAAAQETKAELVDLVQQRDWEDAGRVLEKAGRDAEAAVALEKDRRTLVLLLLTNLTKFPVGPPARTAAAGEVPFCWSV